MLGLTLMRKRSRALAGYQPPAGNVISNWAGTGSGGTGGLPDGWTAFTLAGVTFSVVSSTPFNGANAIEFLYAGTATASGSVELRLGPINAGAAAAGQVWRARVLAERVGVASPGDMIFRINWRDAAQVATGVGANMPANGSLAGPEIAPADSTAPANTAFAAVHLRAAITAGQSVNLRYKVFAPTLWRVS